MATPIQMTNLFPFLGTLPMISYLTNGGFNEIRTCCSDAILCQMKFFNGWMLLTSAPPPSGTRRQLYIDDQKMVPTSIHLEPHLNVFKPLKTLLAWAFHSTHMQQNNMHIPNLYPFDLEINSSWMLLVHAWLWLWSTCASSKSNLCNEWPSRVCLLKIRPELLNMENLSKPNDMSWTVKYIQIYLYLYLSIYIYIHTHNTIIQYEFVPLTKTLVSHGWTGAKGHTKAESHSWRDRGISGKLIANFNAINHAPNKGLFCAILVCVYIYIYILYIYHVLKIILYIYIYHVLKNDIIYIYTYIYHVLKSNIIYIYIVYLYIY